MTFHIGKVFSEELTQAAALLTVIHEVIITKINLSDNFYVEMGDSALKT